MLKTIHKLREITWDEAFGVNHYYAACARYSSRSPDRFTADLGLVTCGSCQRCECFKDPTKSRAIGGIQSLDRVT